MTTPSTNNRYIAPDEAEFISRRMRDISARINCHMIGEIVSFNAENQTAEVKVTFLKKLQGINPIGNTGYSSDEIVSYPQLVDVPIIFIQGGGSYLTFPVSAGDTCLILFCDRDMDSWFQAGLTATPNSNRVHDINDAIALVGLRNLQNSLASYDTNNVVLGNADSYIKIPKTPSSGIASIVDRTGERLSQSGDLKPTARSTAPSGWLLCYGQSLATTTYPDLFDAIGYTYGGSGANFNVPDMRGRDAIGLDNMGGSNANVLTNTYTPNRNTLGGAIGEETHTLTIPELAKHLHVVGFNSTGSSGMGTFEEGGGSPNMSLPAGNAATYQGNSAETGSDTPHYNVQPGRMFNWLIKI